GFAGKVRPLHGAQLLTNPRYPHLPRANSILIGALEPPVPWEEIEEEAEPHLRPLNLPTRRVVLFGDETADRMGGSLLARGFRPRTVRLLAHDADSVPVSPGPGAAVWVDPFRMPARYALRYRIAQEALGQGVEAAESARLYMSRADVAWRRTAASFEGTTMAAAADLTRVGSLAEINTVETAPEFRGRGLASALVEFLVAAAIEGGAVGTYLVTPEEALEREFYAPLGFHRVGSLHSFQRSERTG
ncbi:MAG TPA: GNAT family N-acetyltransferase, partial [Thermoplasmata archaeon]|nr:GNAT family N-acetyltransferase [Thermoplasmata archaeon]